MTSAQITAVWGLASTLLLPVVLMMACRFTLERVWPIEPARRTGPRMNILAYVVWFSTVTLFAPGVNAFATFAVNQFGGGLIALPTHGWGLIGGFLIYFLVVDLCEYLFHRAEHVFPWLWSMHSLHHSDAGFDSTTSLLHHWGAPLVRSITVAVPLGLLFKVPAFDLALYALLANHVYIMHANLRWDFGRLSWLWTSPAYHRVHHSALPEHFDCNYASILPIWDVLFGTYRPMRAGQWPPTGLGEGGEAKSLFDLVFWPVREPLRALGRRRAVNA